MEKDTSPVTGILDESLVIIDFGPYEGRTVQEIARKDPEFYELLSRQKETGVCAIRRQRDKTFRLYRNPLTSMDQ